MDETKLSSQPLDGGKHERAERPDPRPMDEVKERSRSNRAFRMAAKRMKRRPATCMAQDCIAPIEHWRHLCSACFGRLPKDQQRAIARASAERRVLYRAGLIREAIAWLAEHSPAALAARQLGERIDPLDTGAPP